MRTEEKNSIPVRTDTSESLVVNAALSSLSVRADTSAYSVVNTRLPAEALAKAGRSIRTIIIHLIGTTRVIASLWRFSENDMGLGRHQTVAGSGAGLISDLAYNPLRNPRELLVYGGVEVFTRTPPRKTP
jgi:hypothetical protein